MADIGDLQRKHHKFAHNDGNIFDLYEWTANVYNPTLAIIKGDRWCAPTGKYTKRFENIIHLNPSPMGEGYFDLKHEHLVLARAPEKQVNELSYIFVFLRFTFLFSLTFL